MHYDIQRADLMRRIAAGIFDIILLVILATGISWGASFLVDIDGQVDAMTQIYDQYEKDYNVDFSKTEAEIATMPSEEQGRYQAAIDAMNQDDNAYFIYLQVLNSILAMITAGVLGAHLILEFALPLFLKNGQTLGKKIFGIALMRKDGVMLTPVALFIRSILGKCTIEVMVPLLILFLMFLGISGLLIYLAMGLAIAQVLLLFFHPHRAMLHDLMACTVAVDLSSQLIFPTPEALLDHQKEQAAEKAEEADY